jgi:Pyruvate/2-oxoacid:ferredoxin oxidoreductase delta subunit
VFDAAAPGGFLRSLPGLPVEILDREIARITALGVTLRPEPAPDDVVFTDPGGTLASLPHLIASGADALVRARPPGRALATRIKSAWYPESPRHDEILNEADALAEARRCFACGTCMGCGNCWMYCANGCFEKTPRGNRFKLKLELCHGCSRCAEECPSGFIDML